MKLPPERELAASLGVSRNSLRQALKVLHSMGVLIQRTGYGTCLKSDASEILHEPLRFMMLLDAISHRELFETRMIVEPELAARAAERATLEHVGAMRKALRDMEEAGDNRARVIESDLAFHAAVFRAAGNRVCESMFSAIHRSLASSMMQTSQFVDTEHTLKFHRSIFAAIHERRPEDARRSMLEHLTDACGVMTRSGSERRATGAVPEFSPLTGRRRPGGAGVQV
jgi:GntR family transcriptional repressor for pyruvate dehydrogenase complex